MQIFFKGNATQQALRDQIGKMHSKDQTKFWNAAIMESKLQHRVAQFIRVATSTHVLIRLFYWIDPLVCVSYFEINTINAVEMF